MMKVKTFMGNSVGFAVRGRITRQLRAALDILDQECEGGPGGEWFVSRKGRTYVATPNGPFDSIRFDKANQVWKEVE